MSHRITCQERQALARQQSALIRSHFPVSQGGLWGPMLRHVEKNCQLSLRWHLLLRVPRLNELLDSKLEVSPKQRV